MRLDNAYFKKMCQQFISPLVYGTITDEVYEKSRSHVAMYKGTQKLKLSLSLQSGEGVLLERKQAFDHEEQNLIRGVIGQLAGKFKYNDIINSYTNIIARHCQLVGIAGTLTNSLHGQNIIVKIINTLSDWSCDTYEGQRISFSICLDTEDKFSDGVNFLDIKNNDYIKTITSGYDTVVCCSASGAITGYNYIDECTVTDEYNNDFFPIMLSRIANYSYGSRCTFTLNRNGEILIFKKGSIIFSKRRGEWKFFSHKPFYMVLSSIGHHTTNVEVRKAVYQSILDASFQRRGACIGFLRRNIPINKEFKDIVSIGDILSKKESEKSYFFSKVFQGKKFHQLPRKIREEILSIDGATILLDDGTIYAIGAILNISSGSSGGGRTAAAKTLAKFGIGIKVSNDGKTIAWHHDTKKPIVEIG